MGLLPTEKNKRKTNDPKNLIIFGVPKCGKTTSIAELPDNLIIDLENGSDYIEGYTVKANNIQDLYKIAVALTPTRSDGTPNPNYEGHHFKFITIDTVTALEEIALPLAKKLYMETPMGKNFDGDNVLKLPNGAGYLMAHFL